MSSGTVGTDDYFIQVINQGSETVYCNGDGDTRLSHAVPVPSEQTSPVFYVTGTGNSGSSDFYCYVEGGSSTVFLLYTIIS